jgi:hypothetical protein
MMFGQEKLRWNQTITLWACDRHSVHKKVQKTRFDARLQQWWTARREINSRLMKSEANIGHIRGATPRHPRHNRTIFWEQGCRKVHSTVYRVFRLPKYHQSNGRLVKSVNGHIPRCRKSNYTVFNDYEATRTRRADKRYNSRLLLVATRVLTTSMFF